MDMLAELYYHEADTVGQPTRDELLNKAFMLFDHVTHLAVANQSYFHRLFLVLFLSVLCFHARSCANLSAKIIKNIENTSLIVTINRKIWLFLQ
jgi:hypothetical protein